MAMEHHANLDGQFPGRPQPQRRTWTNQIKSLPRATEKRRTRWISTCCLENYHWLLLFPNLPQAPFLILKWRNVVFFTRFSDSCCVFVSCRWRSPRCGAQRNGLETRHSPHRPSRTPLGRIRQLGQSVPMTAPSSEPTFAPSAVNDSFSSRAQKRPGGERLPVGGDRHRVAQLPAPASTPRPLTGFSSGG